MWGSTLMDLEIDDMTGLVNFCSYHAKPRVALESQFAELHARLKRDKQSLIIFPDVLTGSHFENAENNRRGGWMVHDNFPFQVVFDNRTDL